MTATPVLEVVQDGVVASLIAHEGEIAVHVDQIVAGVAHRPWGGRVLTHSGSNTVWYATIWLAPEQGFGVVTACNQGGEPGTRACDDAASAAIQWFLKHRVPPAPGR